MKRDYFYISLFFLISAVILYLFYQIIAPFLVPIIWAGVFTIIFFPLYERLLAKTKRPNLSSVLMCLLVIVVLIGPVTYLFIALVQEAVQVVSIANEWYQTGKLNDLLSFDLPWFEAAREELGQYYDLSKVNIDQIAKDAIQRVSGVLVEQTRWLITNGTRAVFYFVLMIFAMFYFFRDGESLITKVRRLMPLRESQVEEAFNQLRDVTQATMYGGVIIALVQGILGGILFWAVGIPSPVFWGAIMAFLSIIPMVGAFIVYIPAGLIMILSGSVISGLIIILIGSVFISQIDNVLRPYLISGKTSLHPLLLFFTILGGIAVFGLLGMVVGPMIAAAFTILLRVFEGRLNPTPVPPPEPVAD